MLAVIVRLGVVAAPTAPIAPIAQKPAERGVRQHAIPEALFARQRHQGRKEVGGVLLAPDHWNSHFADHRMAGLVAEHEQQVADHEFDVLLALRLRHALQARSACQQARGFGDPALELVPGCRRADASPAGERLRHHGSFGRARIRDGFMTRRGKQSAGRRPACQRGSRGYQRSHHDGHRYNHVSPMGFPCVGD